MSRTAGLEALLAKGDDSALLRYSLGNECLKAGELAKAIHHLQCATARDPDHSAAWKLLGRAYLAREATAQAREAWERGLAAAARRGDRQAEKEMAVFLRRLAAGRPAPPPTDKDDEDR